MRILRFGTMILIVISFIDCRYLQGGDPPATGSPACQAETAIKTGKIASNLLVECSGIDMSAMRDDMLWAVNDSGDGPYLYAVGVDGRDRGRVRLTGAVNRDWEDLSTFNWQGRSMILVADTGDNREHHGIYRMYIVEEPELSGDGFEPSRTVDVAWTIAFRYPDRSHDTEAVGVDPATGHVWVLTKRDTPPLLFSLPLEPERTDEPIVARQVAVMDQIPPPTRDDLLYPYGQFRSQPTAMDLSTDGRKILILTYKHAYLFNRAAENARTEFSMIAPAVVQLPLPQDTPDFVQREAGCFSNSADGLIIASEGPHAAIYRTSIAGR